MSPKDFFDFAKNNQSVILDVRTPQELERGIILNAMNIDIYAPGFEYKVLRLPKDKIICVYCEHGIRSKSASRFLKNNGYSQVKHWHVSKV